MMRLKRPASVLILRSIARQREVRGAEARRVGLPLRGRRAQHRDLGAHRGRELDRHVTEPAETDDPDAIARLAVPLAQRRVRRDAGAEQRRGARGIEPGGDLRDEALVDDDLLE